MHSSSRGSFLCPRHRDEEVGEHSLVTSCKVVLLDHSSYSSLYIKILLCFELENNNLVNVMMVRYAPATQIWRGRLHVMGGSKENRHTPATDHWSIAVENGRAIEKEWRKEVPLPRGGPHRYKKASFLSASFSLFVRIVMLPS